MVDGAAVPKKNRWSWILWWQIDPIELEKQVAEYGTLNLFQSMRGISVLCLAFSAIVTSAMAYFSAMDLDASAFVDVGIMAFLALFIYLGHRWAMIGAMVLWTVEKIAIFVGGIGPHQTAGAGAVTGIIWWAIYMHAFYFAFRIEQKRKASVTSSSGVANR